MLSRLISEVEYDKCKHVTAVNSTKHGIESLAGVKEQTFSFMEACDTEGHTLAGYRCFPTQTDPSGAQGLVHGA